MQVNGKHSIKEFVFDFLPAKLDNLTTRNGQMSHH